MVKSVGEGNSTHSEIYWVTPNSIVLDMKYFHIAQQGNRYYSFNRKIIKIAVENKIYYKKPYRKKVIIEVNLIKKLKNILLIWHVYRM